MIAVRINPLIGIGDAVQFTGIPENYFRHTGEKVVDPERHWVFDHNPYVERGDFEITRDCNMWTLHCDHPPISHNGRTVLLTNAESHARHFGYPIVMNRPRLYQYDNFPYSHRYTIVLHTRGNSHGSLPDYVVEHVIRKYGERVVQVGQPMDKRYRVPFIETPTLWDLARVISKARMFIGPDSGPSWIAQCYPDVITKKVRMIPSVETLNNWVPLEWCRLGSHWDDRSAMIFNPSENDAGFTWSYKKL